MATHNEALLKAIESDLPDFHRKRMADQKGEQAALLAKERAKTHPDAERVASLISEMAQIERNKRDVSITEREVLDPLRRAISEEKEATAHKPNNLP